jgi:hypothetical protein
MKKRWMVVAIFAVALSVTQDGLAFESSKLSPGVIVQNNAFESPKLSVGIVVASVDVFKSAKISAGVVVQLISGGGGGAVQRAPLTHW